MFVVFTNSVQGVACVHVQQQRANVVQLSVHLLMSIILFVCSVIQRPGVTGHPCQAYDKGNYNN